MEKHTQRRKICHSQPFSPITETNTTLLPSPTRPRTIWLPDTMSHWPHLYRRVPQQILTPPRRTQHLPMWQHNFPNEGTHSPRMPNICTTQGHTPNTLRLNSPPGYPRHEEGHHSTNHIPQEIWGVHQNRNHKNPTQTSRIQEWTRGRGRRWRNTSRIGCWGRLKTDTTVIYALRCNHPHDKYHPPLILQYQ